MALFPDLTVARINIEKLLADECVILRDRRGQDDDTWDPDTGTYVRPVDDDIRVYDATTVGTGGRSLAGEQGLGGKCKFTPQQNRSDTPRIEGSRPEITRLYIATLPWDAPEIRPGDRFVVVASPRDPNAAGKTMIVLGQQISTMLVGRHISMEMVSDAYVGVRGS